MARYSNMTVEKTVQFTRAADDWNGGDVELEVTHIRAIPRRPVADNIVPITSAPRAVAAIAQANPGAMELHNVVSKTGPREISIVPATQTNALAMPAQQQLASRDSAHSRSGQWKRFNEIGLGAPKQAKATKAAAKLVVSSYRLLGISILTLIVFVLVGYIGTTAFYFFSKSWVTPTIIAANDPKVVQAKNELAAAQNNRDKLATDLHDTQRAIEVEQQFQLEFTKAVEDDLAGRKEALDRVRGLAGAAAATRAHVSGSTSAYAAAFSAKQKAEFAAGMIDQNQMMSGTYQVAQMSAGSLALAEKQSELEGQARDLTRQTKSLDALAQQQTGTPMSYEVLKIKRDYEASKLALAKALETKDALDAAIKRQDEMIAGLKSSAYLRAADSNAMVALVPYANMDNAKAGTSLYACRAAMVWCREVGTVVDVLPGEVAIKHPHNDSTVRGQMVVMKLTDATAAQDDVLFAGGKPMFF